MNLETERLPYGSEHYINASETDRVWLNRMAKKKLSKIGRQRLVASCDIYGVFSIESHAETTPRAGAHGVCVIVLKYYSTAKKGVVKCSLHAEDNALYAEARLLSTLEWDRSRGPEGQISQLTMGFATIYSTHLLRTRSGDAFPAKNHRKYRTADVCQNRQQPNYVEPAIIIFQGKKNLGNEFGRDKLSKTNLPCIIIKG
uniref:Uncharacterized protein n=1 Tax=Romanomermis culicivorax TaxID=13658 RepID=A0A915K5X1_ROMCU